MVEEKVPCKAESEEHLGFPGTSTELMEEDEEIYRRLNIPWILLSHEFVSFNFIF